MIKRLLKSDTLGYQFIPSEYIPSGADEYYLRNAQSANRTYRALTEEEILHLKVKGNNTSNNWQDIWVSEHFNPNLIQNCTFYGKVRIGHLEEGVLEHHDIQLPIGLYNSMICSCDIGDYNVVNHVHFMSHYLTGSDTMLFNIFELQVSNYAKFGNGILKEGEDESLRIWLELGNENGGRKVLPFDGMLSSDAWLWSKYRDDHELMERFVEMTEASFSNKRGYYGTIGSGCIIKNCQIIKDVKIGDGSYIKGGNKLKNLTINSSFEAPTQLGEGCELVNGIIGFGCRVFYGVKAVRFVLANHSSLKYGARLINSYLGENSTISCCEVLNCLIFPGHEQHHNNSFLIAATVLGQSNIAAGATIGSNHNSRANDGEIIAGRGFWPGLSVSLKHNSKFASFALVSKGAYPAELNIPIPFALIGNNEKENTLVISPAYWWQHNMYALARNAWKFGARDARINKVQAYEFDYLAPDTIEEIFSALKKMEQWVAQYADVSPEEAISLLLSNTLPDAITIVDPTVDASGRGITIMKPTRAYKAYREMVLYFAIKTLVAYGTKHQQTLVQLKKDYVVPEQTSWLNIGGQLIRKSDIDGLKAKVKARVINSWDELHLAYQEMNEQYEKLKVQQAFNALERLHSISLSQLEESQWENYLNETIAIARSIASKTESSRKKDYVHPFRKMVYDSDEEMNAVLGSFEDNSFIKNTRISMSTFIQTVHDFAVQSGLGLGNLKEATIVAAQG
jgi:hypothetical protein